MRPESGPGKPERREMLMTEQAETAQTAMKEKVEAALAQVRPMLQRDGGDVELVEITEDGIAKVRLQGACQGCPMAQVTLQMGIERVLKEMVPDIKSVQAVA
jgi:Fe-S cluster biogenesis protein NfuA